MKPVYIREIQKEDDISLAYIIRSSLEEFGANKPGTAYYDKSTDHLYELFSNKKSAYYVAMIDDEMVGGAGFYPTNGLPADTTELVKMYLSAAARGKGIAKLLMKKVLAKAAEKGYQKIYIETMPELSTAVKFYEKTGFEYLPAPLGNSGHTDCSIWMIKKL